MVSFRVKLYAHSLCLEERTPVLMRLQAKANAGLRVFPSGLPVKLRNQLGSFLENFVDVTSLDQKLESWTTRLT
jgi:hypothetical protein